VIEGNGVRLRAIEKEDLPRYVNWLNDPEVRAGLNLFLPLSMAEEERWYQAVLDREEIERPLAIDVLEGERWIHIGGCGLFNFHAQAQSAELGIALGDKTRWDRGHGSEAMRVLLRYGFNTLNLHRIALQVFESNARARHVYQQLGFVQEGRLRQARYHEGKFEDIILMGILRDEWRGTLKDGSSHG
jgi:RimJ/RimL family protein N-acetyltransferase